MGDKEKFIKNKRLNSKCLLPINYFLMTGEDIILNDTIGGIIQLTECNKLNSKGYKCIPFYKKISRY